MGTLKYAILGLLNRQEMTGHYRGRTQRFPALGIQKTSIAAKYQRRISIAIILFQLSSTGKTH